MEHIPEGQEQLAGPLLVARLLEHPEGAAVVAGGLLKGELRGGTVAGRRGVARRLVGPGRAAQEEVVSQLRQVRLRVAGVQLLERVADLPVEADPARGRQLLVHRVAYQHVGEAQAADAVGQFADEPRGYRLLERREEVVLLQPADALQRVELELASQHRCQGQDLVAAFGHALEPAAYRLTDALGDGEPFGLLVEALRGEEPPDLAGEQRVAVGLLVHPRRQVVVRRGSGDLLEQPRGLRAAQPLQREAPDDRKPCELGEGLRQLGPDLTVAVAGNHEDLRAGELLRDESEQQDRRGVRGVQVVEADRERLGRRGAAEE